MKTKFKYFKCLWLSKRKVKKMYEQGEISDKMYSNLLAYFKRFKWYIAIIILAPNLLNLLCHLSITVFNCNKGELWYFSVDIILLILLILIETYIGTRRL